MKTCLALPLAILFFAIRTISLSAQTATPSQIPELEQKLTAATAAAEKAELCNELSFAWQKKDPSKAIQYAEEAQKWAKESGSRREEMKALNLLGDAALRQNNNGQAEKAYQEAHEQSLKASDLEMQGRALHNLGKLAQKTGNLDSAVSYYEKAFQMREQIGDQAGLSSTVQNLAVLYAQRNDLEKSNVYYLRALQLKEAVGDRAGIATVQSNLANNYAALSRYTDAELMLRSAIQTNTDIGNQTGVAQGNLSLGTVLEKIGKSDAALDCFEKAVSLYQKLGDKGNVCGALNNIAQCLTGRAEYPQAQQRFLEALKITEELPQVSGLRYNIYQGLGRINGFQGLFREELDYYAKAMPYAADDFMRITLLQAMAAAYIGDLQFEKGLSVAQEGFQLARDKGFREREADCLYQAASAQVNLNRLPEALQSINKAISTAQKIQYKSLLPAAMVVRSRVLTLMDQDHKAALAAAQQALALAQKTGQPLEAVHAWEELAEAYRALNETDKAMDALRNSQRLRDSIFNKADIRTLAVQEKEYEFDKEREAQRKEKEQMERLAAAELERQRAQKSLWIFGLASLLGLGLLSFFFWRNRQHTRTKLREAETRQRLASDLHDDLGSTLSSISILSEAVQQPAIGEKARLAMESMDDIVWSVNPNNDTMINILQRMKEFAVEILEPQGIALHFEAGAAVKNLNLTMEHRKDFYLLFKEAVNNAAKYSGASDVWVSMWAEDNQLRLEVRDNGRGFHMEQVRPGNGLKSIRQRAERMGGQLSIESTTGKGTRVELTIPIPS